MRGTTLLRILLDQKQMKVTGFELTEDGLIVAVAPTTRVARCGGCGCKAPTYDSRPRQWRHLDFAGMRVWLRYEIRRADCKRCHAPTTELVPWAEHASPFTRDFEDTVALMAQKADKTTVRKTMGIAWQTVGAIVERVVARRGRDDLLEGLRDIGIDEISYKKHHHYLTVVTDHVRGCVVWVGVGKTSETLGQFFDLLGEERTARLKTISIDMSKAFIEAVQKRAPEAEIVFDRFHVQRLVHNALDEVRREEVRERRGTEDGRAIKKTRWPLQKNPWNLTPKEADKLATVQAANRRLFRAYLLKETFCEALDGEVAYFARVKLHAWIAWAMRSQLEPFRKAASTVQKYIDGIVAYVATGLSNGRSEGMNSKVRTITKRSYGFHDAGALMAMIYLCCTGLVLAPVRHFPAVRGC